MTATLLLATLKELPRKGSLQEAVLHHFLLQREVLQAEETKVLVRAMTSKEGADIHEIWVEHVRNRFPWIAKYEAKNKEESMKVMNEELASGPFTVTPSLPGKPDPMKLKPLKLPSFHEKKIDVPDYSHTLGAGMSRVRKPRSPAQGGGRRSG